MAIAAMVIGILPWCTSWVFFALAALVGFIVGGALALVAIILGAVAIKQVNANATTMGGKGMAIAGLVLGIVYIAGTLLFVIIMLVIVGSIVRELGEFIVASL